MRKPAPLSVRQVNLLNPAYQKSDSQPSAKTIALALGATYALFVVYNMLESSRIGSLKTQETEAETRLVAARADHDRAKESMKGKEPNKRLIEEVERLEFRLSTQKDVLAAIESGGLGDTRGFADALAALGRQRVDGVWLTEIVFNAADERVLLKGLVVKPELLPQYLKALNQEEVLRGRAFGEMSLASKEVEIKAPGASKAASDSGARSGGRTGGSGADARAEPGGTRLEALEFQLGSTRGEGSGR